MGFLIRIQSQSTSVRFGKASSRVEGQPLVSLVQYREGVTGQDTDFRFERFGDWCLSPSPVSQVDAWG